MKSNNLNVNGQTESEAAEDFLKGMEKAVFFLPQFEDAVSGLSFFCCVPREAFGALALIR